MALQDYTMSKFKGLNLDDSYYDIGFDYAADAANFEFSSDGGIQQRHGLNLLSSTGMTKAPRYTLQRPLVNKVLAIAPGEIAIYDPLTGAKTVPSGGPTWTATAVTPPAAFSANPLFRHVFIATTNAGAGVQLQLYEDTSAPSFAVVATATACKPQYVALWPGQNRLVQAGFYAAADAPGGANGSPSTLFFSDENAPDTYTATNFLRLDPGDAERITGVVGFQNQLFVFKYTKVYVFYGVEPDDDGLPIFRYRTITLPDSIFVTSEPTDWNPVTPGPDGVYFAGTTGLWKTTGGTPTRVPSKVSRIFTGSTNTDSVQLDMNVPGQLRLGFNGDKLWLLYPTPNSDPRNVALFWDTRVNGWMVYNPPSRMPGPPLYMANTAGSGGTPMLMFGYESVGAVYQLYREDIGSTADLAQTLAITSIYDTGFSNLGSDGEKRARFLDAWGRGHIGLDVVAVGRRETSSLSSGTTALDLSGSSRRDRVGVPIRGRRFQISIAGDAGTTAGQLPAVEYLELRYSQGSDV